MIEDLVGDADDESVMLVSLRQMDALEALHSALGAPAANLGARPLEVALVDLREALAQAPCLLGREVADVVLDRIFASFCLGK